MQINELLNKQNSFSNPFSFLLNFIFTITTDIDRVTWLEYLKRIVKTTISCRRDDWHPDPVGIGFALASNEGTLIGSVSCIVHCFSVNPNPLWRSRDEENKVQGGYERVRNGSPRQSTYYVHFRRKKTVSSPHYGNRFTRGRKETLSSIHFRSQNFSSPSFFLFFFLSLHLDYNEIKKSAEQQSVRFWKDLAEGGFVERKEGWKRKVENKSGDSSGWVTRAGP